MDSECRISDYSIIQEKGVDLNIEYVKDQIRESLFLKTNKVRSIINENNINILAFQLSKKKENEYIKLIVYGCNYLSDRNCNYVPFDEFAIFANKKGNDNLSNRVKYVYQEYLKHLPNFSLKLPFNLNNINVRLIRYNKKYKIEAPLNYLWNDVLGNLVESEGNNESRFSLFILFALKLYLGKPNFGSGSVEEIKRLNDKVDSAFMNVDNLIFIIEEKTGLRVGLRIKDST